MLQLLLRMRWVSWQTGAVTDRLVGKRLTSENNAALPGARFVRYGVRGLVERSPCGAMLCCVVLCFNVCIALNSIACRTPRAASSAWPPPTQPYSVVPNRTINSISAMIWWLTEWARLLPVRKLPVMEHLLNSMMWTC